MLTKQQLDRFEFFFVERKNNLKSAMRVLRPISHESAHQMIMNKNRATGKGKSTFLTSSKILIRKYENKQRAKSSWTSNLVFPALEILIKFHIREIFQKEHGFMTFIVQ